MSADIKQLGKSDKMRGLLSILLLFRNKFNKDIKKLLVKNIDCIYNQFQTGVMNATTGTIKSKTFSVNSNYGGFHGILIMNCPTERILKSTSFL